MGLGSASNKTSYSSWKTEKVWNFVLAKISVCLGYVCTRLQLHTPKGINPKLVLTYLKSIGLQWQRLLLHLSEAPAITRDKSLLRLALSKNFLIELHVDKIISIEKSIVQIRDSRLRYSDIIEGYTCSLPLLWLVYCPHHFPELWLVWMMDV